MRILVALLALTVAACGSRSDLDELRRAEREQPDPPATCEEPDVAPSNACGELALALPIEQACEITSCAALDAEGFAPLRSCDGCLGDPCEGPLEDHRVFAMGRLGSGHVVGSCDSTTAESLVASFKSLEYLGRTPAPRVASIGHHPCNKGLAGATYLGKKLPAAYVSAAALAEDWDVLIACGGQGSLEPADLGPRFAEIVTGFVRDEGKGLLALADYVCAGTTPEPAMAQLNEVVGLAGFEFSPVSLGYGDGSVDLSCVPDYVP
jgi:hypothetical protein